MGLEALVGYYRRSSFEKLAGSGAASTSEGVGIMVTRVRSLVELWSTCPDPKPLSPNPKPPAQSVPGGEGLGRKRNRDPGQDGDKCVVQ